MNLTGKKNINKFNLSGKNITSNNFSIVNKLKIRIMNLFILPLLSNQWEKINKNLFLLDYFRENLEKYARVSMQQDILLYVDILNIFEILMDQRIQLDILKTDAKKTSDNEIINMVYRTTMIKIKPEYELYDNIIGKPKREENMFYKEDIIKDIQKYMMLENTSFEIIQKYITNKYTKQ